MVFHRKITFVILYVSPFSQPCSGWVESSFNEPLLNLKRGVELPPLELTNSSGANSSTADFLAMALLVHITPRVSQSQSRALRQSLTSVRHRHKVTMMQGLLRFKPRLVREKKSSQKSDAIVIVGGGVSGIWAALELADLGYSNITLIEKEARIGGKAAAFSYAGKQYPLGAVGTSLALESGSFTESQIFEKPLRFGASLLGRTGRRLQILNANNLLLSSKSKWAEPFPADELLSRAPVEDWQRAFGAKGAPSRFYPNHIDFSSLENAVLAEKPTTRIIPRWGRPQTSWPLVYVSAHGYGVAEAKDAPPLYYWYRFAQKSTNAGAAGVLSNNGPLRLLAPYEKKPIGPRGPALRGWDSTALFEKKLMFAGIKVRTGDPVVSIKRGPEHVEVQTANGHIGAYDHLVLASDLRGALMYLEADDHERSLFSSIVHQPYYTVASFTTLPWLATGSVYYLAENQALAPGRSSLDAGHATAGCPTILLKANKGSDLTLSWAYGGRGIGPAQIEECLKRNVESLGGKFGGIYFIKQWPDYFPHYETEQLRSNFHKQLDALQGKKRMYMVGEIFNLPLVSECVDWARHLIRKHFRMDLASSTIATTA